MEEILSTPTSQTIFLPGSITETRLMWGMPITVKASEPGKFPPGKPGPSGSAGLKHAVDLVFDYFTYIDEKFSTYKPLSEISLINQGALSVDEASHDMRTVLSLSEQMRQETGGYFDIRQNGMLDPSGLVKGWAIANAADMLQKEGYEHYCIEAGGDIFAAGLSPQGAPWKVGIRSPFNPCEIVKIFSVSGMGVATSGNAFRGEHITDPLREGSAVLPSEVLSITVIGPDICAADCYATAAYAIGRRGIELIESIEGYVGYMIDTSRQATFTSGFERVTGHALD